MATLKTKIRFRRSTYEKLKDIILESGEPCYITDTYDCITGDGLSTVAELVERKNNQFASLNHKHAYTPSGEVTSTFTGSAFSITPTFTGINKSIQFSFVPKGTISLDNYTPKGEISTPTFNGVAATINSSFTPKGTIEEVVKQVNCETNSVNDVVSVGTLPQWNTQYDEKTATLSFSWLAGSLPTVQQKSFVSNINTTIKAPTFTGVEDIAVGGYTPTGTISEPIFTGNETSLSGTFTGQTIQGSADYKPEGNISTISHTPEGTISSTFVGIESTTGEQK